VGVLPPTTTFVFTNEDTMRGLFERAKMECPGALADRETFLKSMSSMYDSYCSGGGGGSTSTGGGTLGGK
jgi:hypothetical protein